MTAVGDSTLNLWGNKLTCKTWHEAHKPPLLALHGWLDNAGSFDKLAPALSGYHVIAPDLAGHGLSDHRSTDSAYNLWQDVGDMAELLRRWELEPTVLVGHSRGAMVATMLAALYPEAVRGLVLLDGIMPVPVAMANTVEQLRKAFADHRKYLEKPLRHYPSYDEAIQSRLRGPLGLSRHAADILAARGLGSDREGYYWRADPRLRAASEFKLTAAHSMEFVKKLRCPTLVLLTLARQPFIFQLLAASDCFDVVTMEGRHHLHLEETHGEVAAKISNFLARL